MKNIKILIIEDEVLIAEHIKDYLTGFGFSELFMVHAKKAGIEAIEYIQPDLILLDLHLEKPKDGIDIAKYIDDKYNIPYIFITANADILIVQEAVQTKATGYISKPIKKTELFASIQLALKPILKPQVAFLLVKENNETIKVMLEDILYLESSSNYIIIYTKGRKIITRQSLEWAEFQLSRHQFMKVHRCFIINLHAIEKMTSKSVWIHQTEIPVSRTYGSKIHEFLKNGGAVS